LGSEREGGTVYVILEEAELGDASSASRGETTDPRRDQSELVAILREQLSAERQAHAEARRIIMQQAVTMRQLTAAPQEHAEDAETVEEATDEAEPHSATGEARDELGDERLRREMAETTLQEGMFEERRRREEAERERDELRREVAGLGRRTEAPETTTEASDSAEHRPATGGAQEGTRRPWWRKLIGR
jgi:hypothetical protein